MPHITLSVFGRQHCWQICAQIGSHHACIGDGIVSISAYVLLVLRLLNVETRNAQIGMHGDQTETLLWSSFVDWGSYIRDDWCWYLIGVMGS